MAPRGEVRPIQVLVFLLAYVAWIGLFLAYYTMAPSTARLLLMVAPLLLGTPALMIRELWLETWPEASGDSAERKRDEGEARWEAATPPMGITIERKLARPPR